MIQFDVLFPVYINDGPDEVERALLSIDQEDMPPRSVVVICDGPVTSDVDAVLCRFKENSHTEVLIDRTSENYGLGVALARGVELCRSDYVARMDADDVSVPGRFAAQMRYLQNHPDVDVLGGQMMEFDSHLKVQGGVRMVPTTHAEIVSRMNTRNPFNHVTVMLRRDKILASGNYRSCVGFEDYLLWLRLRRDGACFANLPQVLSHVRGGAEMMARRGGTNYWRSSVVFLRIILSEDLVAPGFVVFQFLVRSMAVFIPGRLRLSVYRLLLRK